MANKKKANRSQLTAERRSGGGPLWWRAIVFFLTPPGLFLTLIAGAAAFIYWRWAAITAWTQYLTGVVWSTFGWGLGVLLVGFTGVVWVARSGNIVASLRRWNRTLGTLALLGVVWGVLGLLGSGGNIGLFIAGQAGAIGIIQVAIIALFGVCVIFPGPIFNGLKTLVMWASSQLAGLVHKLLQPRLHAEKPAPRQITKDEPSVQMPLIPKEEPTPPREARILGLRKKKPPVPEAASPAAQPVSDVAREVWKQFVDSPDGVVVDGWRLPPIEIFEKSPEVQFSEADNAERAKRIEEALASYGVDAKVVQINAGPTVTQFGLEPGWDRKVKEVKERDRDGNMRSHTEEISRTRVKVDRITSLANDLSLALAAPSIRIEAPVPGKAIVGVEVPNVTSTKVMLRGVIEANSFQKVLAKGGLALALGKGAGGEAVAADLTKMPHLLIAGSTGSGKTVCLNAIICCLILNNTPDQVRFIMIDPKRVELTTFNTIPHLATPVIVDPEKAVLALRGLVQEMTNRYKELAATACRNIESYNKTRKGKERMPFLVLVVDELADLMMTAGDEVEQILCRLAQLARAVGIHLVVATQRPSVDVVTGLIKANFPTRISFAVTSQVDSRTILDMVGAEKLLGSGDMLFMATESGKPKRLQGCYVSDAEAERLVFFWNSQQAEAVPPLFKVEDMENAGGGKGGHPEDSLLPQARQLALEHGNVSASFLQRRLRIGYPRAARLMEQIQEELALEGTGDDDLWEEEEDEEGKGAT